MKKLFAFLLLGFVFIVFSPSVYSYDNGPPGSSTIDETVVYPEFENNFEVIEYEYVHDRFERGVTLSPGDRYVCSGEQNDNYSNTYFKTAVYTTLNQLNVLTAFNRHYVKGRCTFY